MEDKQLYKYELNNVVEAFTIFEHLIGIKGTLSLTQLSKTMSYTKNKTFRMLSTLQQYGYVEKDLQNKYSIGFAAFEAARKIMSKISILDRVQPYLKEVTNIINETTYYAYINSEEMLLIDFADCNRPVKVASLVGRSIKLPSTILRTIQQKGLGTIGDIIVDTGGFDPEITAVIAPIDFHMSIGQGALVVVAPNCRMHMERIRTEIVPALRMVIQRNLQSKLTEPKPVHAHRMPTSLEKRRVLFA